MSAFDEREIRHQERYGEGSEGGTLPLILTPAVMEDENLAKVEKIIRRFARGGLVIVTGMPGSGKDMFGNWLSKAIKTCYSGKVVFRDEKPKEIFGGYELFNEKRLMAELRKMSNEAVGLPAEIARGDQNGYAKVDKVAEEWLRAEGGVKLQNGVLYLTEFWRYCHNRRPHNPMGILVGAIIKQMRHLDLLIIGTAQRLREIDRISVHPYITHQVKCKWSRKHKDTAIYRIYTGTIVGEGGTWECGLKRKVISLCGAKPKTWLGGGRIYDLYVSKSRPQIIPPREEG